MSRLDIVFVGSRQMMSSLADIAESNGFRVLGILDHHYLGQKDHIDDIPIIGDERELTGDDAFYQQLKRTCVFFPGNWHSGDQHSGLDLLRRQRIDLLDSTGVEVCNLIHPSAVVTGLRGRGDFSMGRGIQIHAGAIIQSDRVHIGDYCGFEIQSCVSHDAVLGRNVLVGPRSYVYNCNIDDDCYMGIYSRINSVPNRMKPISIGARSTVWHSAEVTRDLASDSVYTNTGRCLRKRVK